MSKTTTIQLEPETKDLLTEQGKMGETYDALVRRLLRELEALRDGKSALIKIRET